MDRHAAGVTRCSKGQIPRLLSHSRKFETEDNHKPKTNVVFCNTRFCSERLTSVCPTFFGIYPTCRPSRRTFAIHVNLEDESSLPSAKEYSSRDYDEVPSEDSSEMALPLKLDTNQLKALLSDAERSKLNKKLSEANQHNRFLKRQLQMKEDDLVNFKKELSKVEFEIQALVTLAEEVARSGIHQNTRKIDGKYIQSDLLSRLKVVHRKVSKQIKGVDAIQSKEISLLWCGMAESVKVMGSFDGWSQGEHLSPEHIGSFNKFSTTLLLRPGRYEIKFLVDGEWHLSPELPTIGEGLMENNLLVVE